MLLKETSKKPRVELVFIEPMQVIPVRESPDDREMDDEAKLDRYRCLVAKRSSGFVLWSRRGNGFTDRCCEKYLLSRNNGFLDEDFGNE